MFRFFITADSNIETGVGTASMSMASTNFCKFIEKQDYGTSLKRLSIIFMCRSPHLEFKQRIRHSKKEQVLYMDIMLDYRKFVGMTHEQRVTALCEKLLQEMPPIVRKYKFDDFDLDKLVSNLKTWFVEHGFIKKN
ncbi:hypothetical protein RGO85_002636 [Acinetobacter baumannii]|uniref:hypothetical protein n=1 Tax=Acinetobacter baumannii TaxID=470 RepID=UPI00233E5C38|nr:hypothetical protein [Acinetobacter baumannii]EKX9890802.1 hypothetical protein [Acinetobacter baumannii]ELA9137038.1 hypothetical protein [Acinetobacter baumannii]ELW9270660.1 hypothetical protein [Acinetobacter baumannii]MDC4759722.1 hypothetical protein [Acinetobacter baumannii]MDC5237916.1 hypothetical protein [Acinetobacter baumannii]